MENLFDKPVKRRGTGSLKWDVAENELPMWVADMELLTIAFGTDYDGFDRSVDTHIKNLRKKLGDDPRKSTYIHTVHGIGYRFGGEV